MDTIKNNIFKFRTFTNEFSLNLKKKIAFFSYLIQIHLSSYSTIWVKKQVHTGADWDVHFYLIVLCDKNHYLFLYI